MNNLNHAKLIGSLFEKTGYFYCEDDNSYTPYTYTQRALACEVNLKSLLTCAVRNPDFFTEMFGDA